MSLVTVEAMLESFPNNPVTKIEGEPTYQTLRLLEVELIQNASSIMTELGGGNHGYLGLVLSAEKYMELTGYEFIPHPNPGPIPTFPDSPTQPQIAQINATHKEQLCLYREQQTAIKALKKQCTTAPLPKFIEELCDPYTGFNNRTIREILDYLFGNYGEVSEGDVEQLEKVFTAPFDPMEPFGNYVKSVEDAMRAAEAAGCPFTPEQVVTKAYNQIHKAGCLSLGCREWKRKPRNERTWANFKLHFSHEVKEHRKEQGDTAKDHYVANSMQQSIIDARSELQVLADNMIKEFKDAMNQEPDVQHSHSTAQLQDPVIKTLMEQNQKLMDMLAQKENVNPNGNKQQGNGSHRKHSKPWLYCWTHGAGSHTSKDCKFKMTGHQDDATFKDRKGGSAFRCLKQSVLKQLENS